MSTPPPLDPPFRGYIETTFDALLVFEAARRGMIPRVTRRLIERERGMVQSGAVFVFDEHESGIKRWTDGLVWSPSRILGNFLVYRETDKKPNPPTPVSGPASSSPQQNSPSLPFGSMPPPYDARETVLGHGALRPRSGSDAGNMDRQRERQLVGSLTNSYKFKGNGLVKKTMSVTVNGFAQHMISYYSVDDVLNGKLRSPSTVPELAALEISPEYLHKQNFRFPPMIEVGQDGIPRYRGEPEEPTSPVSPAVGGLSFSSDFDPYGMPIGSRQRSSTVPMPIPSPSQSYIPGPSSASSAFFDHSQISPPSIVRQNSNSSLHSARPSSSARRYDPYASSPRASSHHSRRQSQPVAPVDYYGHMDVKPQISPVLAHAPNPYNYQPPSTAPSAFADFGTYSHPPPHPPLGQYAPQYAWQATQTQATQGRFHPQQPRDYAPPSSSGSSGGSVHHVVAQAGVDDPTWAPSVLQQPHQAWDGQYTQGPGEWRAAPSVG